MSMRDVRHKEDAPLLNMNPESLMYSESVLGYSSRIIYVFSDDKMVRAEYVIDQPHVDPEKFLGDYENLKVALEPVFGEIQLEQNIWKNSMYKNNPKQWGFAISIGFLRRKSVWQNERTRISLFISGQSHEISTRLEFTELES